MKSRIFSPQPPTPRQLASSLAQDFATRPQSQEVQTQSSQFQSSSLPPSQSLSHNPRSGDRHHRENRQGTNNGGDGDAGSHVNSENSLKSSHGVGFDFMSANGVIKGSTKTNKHSKNKSRHSKRNSIKTSKKGKGKGSARVQANVPALAISHLLKNNNTGVADQNNHTGASAGNGISNITDHMQGMSMNFNTTFNASSGRGLHHLAGGNNSTRNPRVHSHSYNHSRHGHTHSYTATPQNQGVSDVSLAAEKNKVNVEALKSRRNSVSTAQTQTQTPTPTPTLPAQSHILDVGVAEHANPRWRPTMEDAHVIKKGFAQQYPASLHGAAAGATPPSSSFDRAMGGYFAVYDGHGGRECVEFIEKRLHAEFEQQLAITKSPAMALKAAFLRTDAAMARSYEYQYCGSTVASAYICESKDRPQQRDLHVANAGDARIVMCLSDGRAVRLTRDHNPTTPREIERVKYVPRRACCMLFM